MNISIRTRGSSVPYLIFHIFFRYDNFFILLLFLLYTKGEEMDPNGLRENPERTELTPNQTGAFASADETFKKSWR